MSKIRFRDLFKQQEKLEPKTENEDKFFFIGVFTAFIMCFIFATPLLFFAVMFKDAVVMSLNWYLSFISIISFCLFVFFAKRKIINFSYNVAYIYVEKDIEKEKKKKW